MFEVELDQAEKSTSMKRGADLGAVDIQKKSTDESAQNPNGDQST